MKFGMDGLDKLLANEMVEMCNMNQMHNTIDMITINYEYILRLNCIGTCNFSLIILFLANNC